MNIFSSNFYNTVLKLVATSSERFKTVSFKLTEKQPVKERHDRVGPGWFLTDIGYMVKNKRFCSLSDIEKKNKLIFTKISRCFEFPYDCEKKLSNVSLLRFAPRRSQELYTTLEDNTF